jgi:cellulose synthase/poly-beta-1,6-N-acetylglucosamine synthase-like glycosyltransferase
MSGRGPTLAPADRRGQALAVVALATAYAYLIWRWGFTLPSGALWLGIPLVLAESWALVAVTLLVFQCWRVTVRKAGTPPAGCTAAILVPTFNEPPDVLRATVLGALSVRHDPAPEVWVLDDGDRGWVEAMCRELAVRYVVRPEPRAGAKAGNLNHVLPLVSADFLLVLDADHVPFPQFLERTLGYFADPEVAFVQSPQAFYNRSFQHRDLDNPVLNEQSLFYDVICRGKDRHNGTFWCGSSAVLRREALVSVGGVATDTVVEDTHTALKLHRAGWKSVYHYEVLAVGLAPEEVNAFLTQRGRWARGSFQLLRLDNPLLGRGLSPAQRLHYLASLSHYIEGPQRLVACSVPSLSLLTGAVPLATNPILYLSLFLPPLVLVPLATKAVAQGRFRFADSDRYGLLRMGTYTAAAAALFQRTVPFEVTPKGSQSRGTSPLVAVRLQLAVATLALCGAAYQTVAQLLLLPGRLSPFGYAVTMGWALLGAGLLSSTVLWAATVRHRRSAHRFPVELETRFTTLEDEPVVGRGAVSDLNPFGLGMRTQTRLEPGRRLKIGLRLGEQDLDLRGTVAAAVEGEDGTVRAGVSFDELDAPSENAVLRWCIARPFGPAHELGAERAAADARPQPGLLRTA